MKRKLNPEAIMSELGRESAFFRDAAKGPPAEAEPPAPPAETTTTAPVQSAPPVLPDPAVHLAGTRARTRHPFELYKDQLDRLRELSYQDRRRGGMGSMSQMVRDALDQYLARKEQHAGEE